MLRSDAAVYSPLASRCSATPFLDSFHVANLCRPRRITRVPPAIDGELLRVMLLITVLVSKSFPHVFPLPVQQKDPIPDPFNVVSFLVATEFCRAELHSGGNPTAAVPFEVLV
jgi:hypothetical protein